MSIHSSTSNPVRRRPAAAVITVAITLMFAALAISALAFAAPKPAQKAPVWPPPISAEEMTLLSEVREIAVTLRAPCCPELTVAQHDSPTTLLMKKEIREMLLAGKGRGEIVSALAGKYGDVILGTSTTPILMWALYGAPVALSLLLVWLLTRMVRGRKDRTPELLHLEDEIWERRMRKEDERKGLRKVS